MEKHKWKIKFDNESSNSGHIFIDDLDITNQVTGIGIKAHVGYAVTLTLFLYPSQIEIEGLGTDDIIKFIGK